MQIVYIVIAQSVHHAMKLSFLSIAEPTEQPYPINPSTSSSKNNMPLFHRNSASSSSSSARSIEEPNQRSHGLFGGRNSHSSHSSHRSSGSYSSGQTHRRGLLSRHHEDPSIAAAKEQVLRAESAEKAADHALRESRLAVREAKDHVKRLEHEAAEE